MNKPSGDIESLFRREAGRLTSVLTRMCFRDEAIKRARTPHERDLVARQLDRMTNP